MLVNEKIKNSYSASSNTTESQVVFSSRDNRSSRIVTPYGRMEIQSRSPVLDFTFTFTFTSPSLPPLLRYYILFLSRPHKDVSTVRNRKK